MFISVARSGLLTFLMNLFTQTTFKIKFHFISLAMKSNVNKIVKLFNGGTKFNFGYYVNTPLEAGYH